MFDVSSTYFTVNQMKSKFISEGKFGREISQNWEQILTYKSRAVSPKTCANRNVKYAYPVCCVNVVSTQLSFTGALSHNISYHVVIWLCLIRYFITFFYALTIQGLS